MGKQTFHLKYDPDTDILNVSFGRARKSVSVEQEPEVFVRIDTENQEIAGFTVLGFKNSFLTRKQELTFTP
ncbi:TPA: hypothetical protein DIV55_00095 [Patescibacteria group bacterium]|uniref:DUF2283 domain-containing protein n=1 Tax=Candidatus Gottesmanbacteria bacterium GW2011_GWA1_43_11 TaxID=1618436 RepID=A0A0G1ESK5_9BACT|nr:MAG: hypothetical protein UV59_C0003G0046 [Candidatus Gottesmanbacteria bacterium GW2011_GWA1_43_11]HCS78127.1 hypothetical protein [Patescibacteria group bacterium]